MGPLTVSVNQYAGHLHQITPLDSLQSRRRQVMTGTHDLRCMRQAGSRGVRKRIQDEHDRGLLSHQLARALRDATLGDDPDRHDDLPA